MRTNVFLERSFAEPLTPAGVAEMATSTGWCYEAHEVEWRGSLLAADGRTMVCWFESPDAESARIALRTAGADLRMLWPGTVHDAPHAVLPNVLVSRSFAQPVALADIQALEDRHAWCLQTHRVEFSRTFFAKDRKRMLCLYRAPDAEAVRLAQRDAGMPHDAIWPFVFVGGDPPSPA